MENTENEKTFSLLENILFYSIIIPLILISITIIIQRIIDPERIPDIFGIKVFIVMDGNMDSSICYGDLVFTHNIKPENAKIDNVIAFRNNTNKVTIHRIINITKDNSR